MDLAIYLTYIGIYLGTYLYIPCLSLALLTSSSLSPSSPQNPSFVSTIATMKESQTVLYATETLGQRVTEYSEAKSLELPKHLTDYHADIVKTQPGTSHYMISTFQSQALVWLARLMGAKRVLEIGVYLGYSSMVWSHAVGPAGQVTGLEFNAEYADKARAAFAKHGVGNCEIITGPALEQIPLLTPSEPYDVIFIDAKKSEYPGYLSAILDRSSPASSSSSRLLRAGGLIVADNALRRGLVATATDRLDQGAAALLPRSEYSSDEDVERLAEYNEAVRACPRLEAFLCPLWDGVNLARLVD
ncbi:O-methyltransferase [Biscogniauxia mediterranea]|nr:O-methyltransferase [Biscogniauxia mediterranea]